MTISNPTRIAGPYIGATGTLATFPFAFKVFAAADLDVIKSTVSTGVEATLALTTDYTVSLNSDQNSNPRRQHHAGRGEPRVRVQPPRSPRTSRTLQPTDLTNQGGFYPEVINDSLDRSTIQIQQIADDVTRSIQGADLGRNGRAMVLPPAAQRIGKYLAFDASGAAVRGYRDWRGRQPCAPTSPRAAALRSVGFSPTGKPVCRHRSGRHRGDRHGSRDHRWRFGNRVHAGRNRLRGAHGAGEAP
jgi:hypothetical protein